MTETVLRASCISEQQLAVPAGIRINLYYGLMTPVEKRSLRQPSIAGYSIFSCFVVSN